MIRIDFHFNAKDKVSHACRLARKAALAHGAKVVLVGDAATLDTLDAALWQLAPTDFLAHCRSDAPPSVLARSPVVLAPAAGDAPLHRQILINLGETVPAGFERFERLFELVGCDAPDRDAARLRWRHYGQHGYAIERQDLAQRSTP